MNQRLCAPLTAVALLGAIGAAHASPISDVVVFGDSLSDNGNLAEDLSVGLGTGQGFPNPPFAHDAFTNGPTAVDLLTRDLTGHVLQPSLWGTGFADVSHIFGAGFVPGNNFAVAGALASNTQAIDLPEQVAAYSALVHNQASASDLYVLFIGGNDVRAAAANPAQFGGLVQQGVANEVLAVKTLIGQGARNLLVVGVGDVGAIPESTQRNDAAVATADSIAYNKALAAQLAPVALANANVVLNLFDFFGFSTNVGNRLIAQGFDGTDPCFVNAASAIPGLTGGPAFHTTAACGATAQDPTNDSNIDDLLFWDNIHPTAPVQAAWADGLLNAIPEPASGAVFGLSVLVLLGLRRRAVM